MSDDGALRRALGPAIGAWRSRPRMRDAAVLVPLVRDAGQDWLLLTQRRADLRNHGGQMSFPGGSRDGDENALECALRETHEEIGAAPDHVDVLGRLDDIATTERFAVAAFVGRLGALDGLRPDPNEVEALVPIPVAELRRAERWEWRPWRRRNGVVVQVPHFAHDGYMLWGMSGWLTQQLLQRWFGEAE